MAASHGSKAYFSLQAAAGGAEVNLSSYLTSISFPRTIETAQTEGLGSTAKTYVIGLEDGQITLEGIFDPVINTQLNGLKRGMTSAETTPPTWTFGPQNNTTGNPKYTGSAFLTAFDPSGNLTDAVKFSATLQLSGVVTLGVF